MVLGRAAFIRVDFGYWVGDRQGRFKQRLTKGSGVESGGTPAWALILRADTYGVCQKYFPIAASF
jgi:hypothetical protein